MGWDNYGYKPYVPVATRRAKALREVAKLLKKGQAISPVQIEGRNIALTFWGKAWCANLESYSDFENRLPRGRTYVRNGSVVHLTIEKGRVEALVSGSELYKIQIEITALPKLDWQTLKRQSAGEIGTLIELLKGKLSKSVMELVTGREHGLFPKPKEIKMRCSCPDGAYMCKHIAATLYGVGNRLDSNPELLFVLRGVDHLELIEQAIPTASLVTRSSAPTLAMGDLEAIFDIEIGDGSTMKAVAPIPEKPSVKPSRKKADAGNKTATTKAAAPIPEKPSVKQTLKKAYTRKKAAATKSAAPVPEARVAQQPRKKAQIVSKTAATKSAASLSENPAAKHTATKARAEKNASVTKKTNVKSVPKKL